MLSLATPAAASVFAWDFAGSGFTAAGTLTTDDTNTASNPYPCVTCANGPGNLVTNFSGSLNGNAITLLAPGTFQLNDNRFYSQGTNGALDYGGISFSTIAGNFNIFAGDFTGHIDQTFLVVGTGDAYVNPVNGHARLLSDAVPETATWAMMVLGFGFVGAAMRMSSQRQAVRYSFV
jgi:hypothetical protein